MPERQEINVKKSVGITVVGGLAAATLFGVGVLIMKDKPSAAEPEQKAGTVADVGEVVEAAVTMEAGPQTMDVKEAEEEKPAESTISSDGKAQGAQETETSVKEDADNAQTQGEDKTEEETQTTDTETSETETEQQTEEESDIPSPADEEVNSYLADSVIIGDSIVLGYRNYCRKSEDEALQAINFLAAGSFSAHNALWPVSDKSVHPVYQGAQHPIWESIEMMGVKNIFLCFGLNDLNIDDKTIECYREVIDNIIEKSPDVQIHIISMTYTLKDQGKGKLNNDEIRVYNTKLKEMAEENGWGYVDMASALEDEEGNLTAEFCSDGFLHQNPAAYDVWTEVLRSYVAEWLNPGETADNKEETVD